MNNFGVIEVATARTTNAPGWAYVPDTGPAPSSSAGGGGPRSKRARNTGPANLSHADLTARQEAKARRELEVLDRDNARDAVIPVPQSKRTNNKHTPNVRKILQSQKTFANHLDDYIAAGAGLLDHQSAAVPAAVGAGGSARSAAAAATAAIRRERAAGAAPQRKPDPATGGKTAGNNKPATHNTGPEDVEMPDAAASDPPSSILEPYAGARPAPHPADDDDPLLASIVPPLPSDEELRQLLAAPPLTYLDAKAGWNDEDRRYPARVFCEVCGYWGRVRCMKCGVRVCALECLEAHREECVTRYGL
ncbi:hypothetical protein LQW54_007649 [Pestalotiopsis sp. IQ-011]